MPTSRPLHLGELYTKIIEKNYSTFLDVGCGFGKNGFLIREYQEVWKNKYTREHWTSKVDAIEIFEKYLTPVHSYIYDNVHVGNCLDILPGLPKYDLIICTAMIEHLEKEDAKAIMEMMIEKSSNYYFTIPKVVGNSPGWSAKGVGFNKFEAHISGEWTMEELSHFGDVKLLGDRVWRITNV